MKLYFQQHICYYANKALFTIKGIKMLSNLARELSLIYKHLLYRTHVFLIALYGFQLQYFKGSLLYQPPKELKKMKRRAVLQITKAFYTSPSWGLRLLPPSSLFTFTSINLQNVTIPEQHLFLSNMCFGCTSFQTGQSSLYDHELSHSQVILES